MATLNRDAILSAQDLKTETIEVPEWGGSVNVRGLTAAARNALFTSAIGQDGKVDQNKFQGSILAMSIVDDSGGAMFTPQDAEALMQRSGAAVSRVAEVATRLSGLSPEAVDAAQKN